MGDTGRGNLEHVATLNHLIHLYLPISAAAPPTPSLPHTLLWAASGGAPSTQDSGARGGGLGGGRWVERCNRMKKRSRIRERKELFEGMIKKDHKEEEEEANAKITIRRKVRGRKRSATKVRR